MNSTILSTKVLTYPQQQRILNADLGLVGYNAIAIELEPWQTPFSSEHVVFTSQNGVRSFVIQTDSETLGKVVGYCVGEKTRAMLESHGIRVKLVADKAEALANQLVNTHADLRFTLVQGNMARPELGRILKKNNVRYDIIQAYRTELTPKTYQRSFDGVLFFSPSAVTSHCSANSIAESVAFCIGETTAEAAKVHTDHTIIANRPTIENVLVQAIKYYT
ncbi:uroporphyrinogen-III synthase [Flagellimonas sp. DF-77]|uniref:uroporphyrinogen-III synthase n=1 Tax=Flagellimonas algarum TaxID=3230298 RepID=UPI003398EA5B